MGEAIKVPSYGILANVGKQYGIHVTLEHPLTAEGAQV